MNLHSHTHSLRTNPLSLGIAILSLALLPASAQTGSEHKTPPWMNSRLSPDERAALVVKEMTLDEKISLLHGTGMASLGPVSPLAVKSNGGAGYVVGIPRLGIPAIQMSDAAYGVRNSGENGRYSTALPDDLAGAASARGLRRAARDDPGAAGIAIVRGGGGVRSCARRDTSRRRDRKSVV